MEKLVEKGDDKKLKVGKTFGNWLWPAWIQLMLAQKLTAATLSSFRSTSMDHRPGTCWLFNEGHYHFFASCKYKHEFSICGELIQHLDATRGIRWEAGRQLQEGLWTSESIEKMLS